MCRRGEDPSGSEGGRRGMPDGQASATSHGGRKTHGTGWAREAVPAKNINKFKEGFDELGEEWLDRWGQSGTCLRPVSWEQPSAWRGRAWMVLLAAKLMFSCQEIKKESKQANRAQDSILLWHLTSMVRKKKKNPLWTKPDQFAGAWVCSSLCWPQVLGQWGFGGIFYSVVPPSRVGGKKHHLSNSQ